MYDILNLRQISLPRIFEIKNKYKEKYEQEVDGGGKAKKFIVRTGFKVNIFGLRALPFRSKISKFIETVCGLRGEGRIIKFEAAKILIR